MEMNLTHFVHNLLNLKGHKPKAPRSRRWCSLIRNFSFVFDRKKENFKKALCNKFLKVNRSSQIIIWTKTENTYQNIGRNFRWGQKECWGMHVRTLQHTCVYLSVCQTSALHLQSERRRSRFREIISLCSHKKIRKPN